MKKESNKQPDVSPALRVGDVGVSFLNYPVEKRIGAYLTDYMVRHRDEYRLFFGEGRTYDSLTPSELHEFFSYATGRDAAQMLNTERGDD